MMELDHQSGTTSQQELYSAGISFGIVKPHAYAHRAEIEQMITQSGLLIPVKKDLYVIPRSLAELQYQEHRGKPFYDELIKTMTSGPTELMVVEGPDAIEKLSALTGRTDPREAVPGTIRERFGDKTGGVMYNAFHRSDSLKSARREILLYWKKEELPPRIAELLEEL